MKVSSAAFWSCAGCHCWLFQQCLFGKQCWTSQQRHPRNPSLPGVCHMERIEPLGRATDKNPTTASSSSAVFAVSGFGSADEVLKSVFGPDRQGTASSTGIHSTTVTRAHRALAFHAVPALLEIAAFVVEAHVMDFASPCRFYRSLNGVHLSSAMRANRFILHTWLSLCRFRDQYVPLPLWPLADSLVIRPLTPSGLTIDPTGEIIRRLKFTPPPGIVCTIIPVLFLEASGGKSLSE